MFDAVFEAAGKRKKIGFIPAALLHLGGENSHHARILEQIGPASQQRSHKSMVALQQGHRAMLIEPQQNDHSACQIGQLAANGGNLAQELIRTSVLELADTFSHVQGAEIAVSNLSPMRARKNAHQFNIFRIKFDFPPLAVFRQLPPHGVAAAEKQDAANLILRRIGQIGVLDDRGELIAVRVIFFMKEFAAKKIGNHLGFSKTAQLPHTASTSSALLWRRRKGNATSASITAIRTILTMITSCSVPWNKPMPTTNAPLNISCSQPVLAMRRDISYAMNTALSEYSAVAVAYSASSQPISINLEPKITPMIKWGNSAAPAMNTMESPTTKSSGRPMPWAFFCSGLAAAVTGNMALTTPNHAAKYRRRPICETAA